MKQAALFLTILFFTGSVLAQKQVINDPNASARKVSSFHALKITNAFDVYLTQGNEDALAVSATKDEYKENIITVVENGTLKVSYKNEKKFLGSLRGDKMKLRVYVSFKNIDNMDIGGACNVHFLTPVKTNELTIKLSGASDMKEGSIYTSKLNIKLSGASDMKQLKGKTTYLNVEASGASDFKSIDFETDYCEVDASGASSVQITVNKELSAKASGASDVKYKGEGLIKDIKTNGASNVSRKS